MEQEMEIKAAELAQSLEFHKKDAEEKVKKLILKNSSWKFM